jgi:hypothetical protein
MAVRTASWRAGPGLSVRTLPPEMARRFLVPFATFFFVMSNSLDHLQQFSVSGCAKGVSAQRRETEPISQRRRLQPCCSIPCCIRQSVGSRGSSDELQPTIACALEEAAAGVRSAAARRCLGLEMEPHAAAVRSRRWSRTQPSCGVEMEAAAPRIYVVVVEPPPVKEEADGEGGGAAKEGGGGRVRRGRRRPRPRPHPHRPLRAQSPRSWAFFLPCCRILCYRCRSFGLSDLCRGGASPNCACRPGSQARARLRDGDLQLRRRSSAGSERSVRRSRGGGRGGGAGVEEAVVGTGEDEDKRENL